MWLLVSCSFILQIIIEQLDRFKCETKWWITLRDNANSSTNTLNATIINLICHYTSFLNKSISERYCKGAIALCDNWTLILIVWSVLLDQTFKNYYLFILSLSTFSLEIKSVVIFEGLALYYIVVDTSLSCCCLLLWNEWDGERGGRVGEPCGERRKSPLTIIPNIFLKIKEIQNIF